MKLPHFVIIKFTLCVILGIYIAYFKLIPYFILQISIIVSIIFLLIALIHSKIRRKKGLIFGILALLIMVLVGALRYHFSNPKTDHKHYSHYEFAKDSNHIMMLRIKERLKPNSYNNRYIADIISIDHLRLHGKLLIHIKRDSMSSILKVDDIIYALTEIKAIPKPKNPFEFDYSQYLEHKYIYHQAFLSETQYTTIESDASSISGAADKIRRYINKKLQKLNMNEDTYAITNALILGQRHEISEDTYDNYVNAGVIHILAVSGLHVGIILMLFNFLLRPLTYFRHGNTIKAIILVLLLWTYACITGLSPSVTRAVSMFSIIAIAMHLKRSTNIYNTIAVSAFFILLIEPNSLFDIGFQMSYVAVLAIVTIQPILFRSWRSKFLILDKLWEISTVTLAAQIGVFPISLYYFHQFPGLFLLSNLIIVPVLGLLIGYGILIIVLASIDYLPSYLLDIYESLIMALNNFIEWVAQFDRFVFRDISFSFLHVISVYIIVITIINWYYKKTFKSIRSVLFGFLMFSLVMLYTNYNSTYNEFIIFHKNTYSLIGERYGDSLHLSHNLKSDSVIKQTVKNYTTNSFIKTTTSDSIQSVYSFNGYYILVIDSLGVYKLNDFKPSYIVLSGSPKVNLNRLIDSLPPKCIIADGSNYKSYVERWKATCRRKKIPFHSTYEKGAFILK